MSAEHAERWRHHRPPTSRHWPRDPDDTNTHPGADPALCPICHPTGGAA